MNSTGLRAGRLPALSPKPRHFVRPKLIMASTEPQTSSESKSKLKLVGPDPKRFTVAEGQLLNVASAAWNALARGGSGGFVAGYNTGLVAETPGKYALVKGAGRALEERTSLIATFPRPAQPLELYEFEGCPFCRKVREALCILDLEAYYYPCPKEGKTWRPKAIELGGKRQFPFLVDPNTGKQMYESDAIIEYLFKTYGNGEVPLSLRMGYFTTITCGLALAPRGGMGSRYKPSKLPEKPLIYWGYEISPFCKIVREKLSELELPHLYRSVARGSPRRQEMLDEWGHFQAPFLEDPNQGVAMWESKAILEYLDKTYTA